MLLSLIEAHRLGLVHRDLKPANLFLHRSDNGDERVKVLDFGLVKLTVGTDQLGNLTRTGVVGGTPTYMSPENARGRPVDTRADLYSLGVILYEMLEGRRPFEADTTLAMLLKHINEPPAPMRAPDVPEELRELVFACMAKEPEDRPQTAELLRDALLAIVLPTGPAWEPTDHISVPIEEAPTELSVHVDNVTESVELPARVEPTLVDPTGFEPPNLATTEEVPGAALEAPASAGPGQTILWVGLSALVVALAAWAVW